MTTSARSFRYRLKPTRAQAARHWRILCDGAPLELVKQYVQSQKPQRAFLPGLKAEVSSPEIR